MTAGRRRCVIPARFVLSNSRLPLLLRTSASLCPCDSGKGVAVIGRETLGTLPAHPQNTVQSRKTGEYIEKNTIFAVGH